MNMDIKIGSPVADSEDRDSADITEHSETMDSGRTNGDAKENRKSTNAKDPSRPRRKKARRACFACQRAHLTCGMHCHSLPFLFLGSPCLSFFLLGHAAAASKPVKFRLILPSRGRTTLPTLYQAWPAGCMPRWGSEKG
jgi:hypothetical protein